MSISNKKIRFKTIFEGEKVGEKPAEAPEGTPDLNPEAETKPSATKPEPDMSAILKATSTPAKNAYKLAEVEENEKFLTIKISVDNFAKNLKNNNDIEDVEKIKALKKINAAFLYNVGWDLFDKAAGKVNLKLAPNETKKVVNNLLPKGKNWDGEQSFVDYDNRKDKNTTLYYYWDLINPENPQFETLYLRLNQNGLHVAAIIDAKSGGRKETLQVINEDLRANKIDLTLQNLVDIAKLWDGLTVNKEVFFKDEEQAAKDNQEDAKTGSKDPSVKRRRRRTSPSGPTVVSTYNIRKAPRDGWIGGYQNNLKRFYDANEATKAIADQYKGGKLTDGRYGFRTHYVTIKAAENIISQLDKFLNPKAPAPAAPAPAAPAAETKNERRIRQLSKLLEIKLVGAELNLFNEQDESAPDAEKKKKLQDLLKELNEIKGRLAAAHNENSIPETDAKVQGEDLRRFNEILSMLSWNTNGEIDFNEVYKKMGSAGTPSGEPKREEEKEKVAEVARTIRGTCWFDFDPNTGGIRSGTPIAVWAAAGADFEEWYKQIVELFNYEGASPQFNYKSDAAAQGRLKGAPSKLNDNKTQSISLACLSIHMTKLADNFRKNGGIATQQLAQAQETKDEANIKKVFVGAKYFLTGKGTYEGSVAHGLEQVLNRVIAILPAFSNDQIQPALKTLANQDASEEEKQAARLVVAYARRDRKAIEKLAGEAKARAAEPTAAAPATPAAGAPAAPIGTKDNPLNDQQFREAQSTPEILKNKTVFVDAAGKIIKYVFNEQGKISSSQSVGISPQQESLKQRRDKLLHEAIFKKLVR